MAGPSRARDGLNIGGYAETVARLIARGKQREEVMALSEKVKSPHRWSSSGNLPKKILLVVNVVADIRGIVEDAVWRAIHGTGELPEELRDLFTLTYVGHEDEWREGANIIRTATYDEVWRLDAA